LTLALILGATPRAHALGPGDQAPDFTAPDQYGRMVSLSDFAGSYVIVDFCSHWCQPCREGNLQSRALIQTLQSAGLPFVHVTALLEGSVQGTASSRPDAEIWAVVFDLPAGSPVVHLDDTYASELWTNFLSYGTPVVPTYVVIHPDGTILHVQKGLDEDTPIATLLKDAIDPDLPDPDPGTFLDEPTLTYDEIRVMFSGVGTPAIAIDETFAAPVDAEVDDRGEYRIQTRPIAPIGFLPARGEAVLHARFRLFLEPLDAAAPENYRSFDVGSFLTLQLRNVEPRGAGIPVAAVPNGAEIVGVFHSEVFDTTELDPMLNALPQSYEGGVLGIGPLILSDFFASTPETTLHLANRLDVRLGVRMIAPHYKSGQLRGLILTGSPRSGPTGQAAGWLTDAQAAIAAGDYAEAGRLLLRVERLVPRALGLSAASLAQISSLTTEIRAHVDFMASR
jgi:hypothetical protein